MNSTQKDIKLIAISSLMLLRDSLIIGSKIGIARSSIGLKDNTRKRKTKIVVEVEAMKKKRNIVEVNKNEDIKSQDQNQNQRASKEKTNKNKLKIVTEDIEDKKNKVGKKKKDNAIRLQKISNVNNHQATKVIQVT